MSEKKSQYEIVSWFSKEYPQLRGCLFEINNNAIGIKHYSTRLAMGMIPGASDLGLFVNGIFASIEIKLSGTKHQVDHIKNQLRWGETIKEQGGLYIISANKEEIKSFVTLIVKEEIKLAKTIQDVVLSRVNMLLETKNKSITF